MTKGHTELSRDARPIWSVFWPVEGAGFTVGQGKCTRIEAYDENGELAHVPWVAVFFGDEIVARIPANQVAVHYKSTQP
jgi:hypothetical protein